MKPWEKYQRQENKIPAKTRELWKVKQKINQVQRKDYKIRKIHSSVSLPNFLVYRMQSYIKKTRFCKRGQLRKISESEVIIACLVLLLRKLRNRKVSPFGPRCRLYNDEKYSYGKVSVYVDRNLWQALHGRAIELEVSLSLLADIAVRLYLGYVLEMWLRKEKKVKTAQHFWVNLYQFVSYQKEIRNQYAKNNTEQAGFLFTIKFTFGKNLKPPPKLSY